MTSSSGMVMMLVIRERAGSFVCCDVSLSLLSRWNGSNAQSTIDRLCDVVVVMLVSDWFESRDERLLENMARNPDCAHKK